uniref:Uncharacterized protein n=1 Tax=Anopheles aquasalis TaxID=42839 RepID=T1DNK5_ANOAQ
MVHYCCYFSSAVAAAAAGIAAAHLVLFLLVDDGRVFNLILILIFVAPSPGWMATVPGTLDALLHDLLGNRFQVVRPANLCEEIDERGSQVHPVVAQLSRLVVPREHMVIVVPSLAKRERCYRAVLRRRNALVIRLIAPLVGCAVHQPGYVQDEGPAEQRSDKPGVGPALVPEVHWRNRWQHETGDRHQNHVVFALETQDGIALQVGNVELLALGNNFRMLAAQQPADVREKEPTGGIMRIGIGFRVLVVHPVIAGPMQRTVLERDRVKHGQYDAEWQLRFVRTVSPQSVGTGRNTQSGHHIQDKCCREDGMRRSLGSVPLVRKLFSQTSYRMRSCRGGQMLALTRHHTRQPDEGTRTRSRSSRPA